MEESSLFVSRYYYWKKMQFFLSNQTKTNTLIRPVKIASVYQSASLIAQEISWKLEQKKSFRQICRSTFQEIEKCQYVKGIRICCSGRLNGAEIAKTECRKYGETSLHVFSDQIDYAKAQASTPYGILGVKVWVSYF
jgi:small subunit ribosomal protein S3